MGNRRQDGQCSQWTKFISAVPQRSVMELSGSEYLEKGANKSIREFTDGIYLVYLSRVVRMRGDRLHKESVSGQ